MPIVLSSSLLEVVHDLEGSIVGGATSYRDAVFPGSRLVSVREWSRGPFVLMIVQLAALGFQGFRFVGCSAARAELILAQGARGEAGTGVY